MEGRTAMHREKSLELPGAAPLSDVPFEAPRVSSVIYARRGATLRRVSFWVGIMFLVAVSVPATYGMATTQGPMTERLEAGIRAIINIIPGAQAAPTTCPEERGHCAESEPLADRIESATSITGDGDTNRLSSQGDEDSDEANEGKHDEADKSKKDKKETTKKDKDDLGKKAKDDKNKKDKDRSAKDHRHRTPAEPAHDRLFQPTVHIGTTPAPATPAVEDAPEPPPAPEVLDGEKRTTPSVSRGSIRPDEPLIVEDSTL